MKKTLALIYSYTSYLAGLGTILYTIGFVGDFLVPKSINSGNPGNPRQAVLVNLGLLALFGIQHSFMARPWFKSWWSEILPKPFQRSTYVLLTSTVLGTLFWLWKPLPYELWNLKSIWLQIPLWLLYALGWTLVLISARMINSGHFFGIQQIKEFRHGKPLSSPDFQTPGLYRIVRHPLMVGFLIAFWASPKMTIGRMLFALGLTAYILIALRFEERDLVDRFGKRYQRYKKQVPMLLPRLVPAQGSLEKEKSSRSSFNQPPST